MYIAISLIFAIIHSTSSYNITKLEPGIIFEKLHTIHLQASTWTFISHINLTVHREEINYVTNLINTIKQQCKLLITHKNRNELCDGIILELEKELSEITEYDEFISYVEPEKSHKRRARGLVNVIGLGMKVLFGTMTEADAEKYMSYIHSLEKSTIKMEHNIEIHTSVLDSALKKINESSIGVNEHSKMIRELVDTVDQIKRSYGREQVYSRTHFLFEELSDFIILALNKIRRDQAKIFDIIFTAKKGMLHELLFDPKSIFNEMLAAQSALRGHYFVYPLKKSNIFKILSLSDFNAVLNNDTLLFEIKTPLIRDETFSIYNTIPIPRHVSNSIYSFIQPEFKTFLISRDHDHYAPFLEPETQLQRNCKNIENNHFICNQNSPLFIAHARRNCEVEYLNTASIDQSICKEQQHELKDEIWISLHEPNSYIFITPEKVKITINCNDSRYYEEIVNSVLINTKCIIKTNKVVISNIQHYHSNYSTNVQRIIPLPAIKNVSQWKEPAAFSLHNKLKPIEPIFDNQLKNIETTSNDQAQQNTHFIITIIVILATILLYIFAIWLYIGGVKSRKRQAAINTTEE